MLHGDIETFHRDGQWYNRVAGRPDLQGPFINRADAALIGREDARQHGAEHTVRNPDGTVAQRNNYAADRGGVSA